MQNIMNILMTGERDKGNKVKFIYKVENKRKTLEEKRKNITPPKGDRNP